MDEPLVSGLRISFYPALKRILKILNPFSTRTVQARPKKLRKYLPRLSHLWSLDEDVLNKMCCFFFV